MSEPKVKNRDERIVHYAPRDPELDRAMEIVSASMDIGTELDSRGRPTKYSPIYCLLARKYLLGGMTDIELARALAISEKTLSNWRREHPEFLQVTQAAKE